MPAPQAERSPAYCFMAGLVHPPKARKSEKEGDPSSTGGERGERTEKNLLKFVIDVFWPSMAWYG